MWETVKLGDICSFQNGYAFKSENYTTDGAFVMRIKNVQDGYITLNDPQYISLDELPEYKPFELKENDILMSLTGNIGRVGIIKKEHLPALLNQRVARLQIKSQVNDRYLFYFLSRKQFQNDLMEKASGAAQKNISTKDISNVDVPLPSLETQIAIVNRLDQFLSELDQTKKRVQSNIDDIDRLWKSILNKAFEGNGELHTIDELCTSIEYGVGETGLNEGELRYVRITDIDENYQLKDYDKKYIHITEKSKAAILNKGDVLIARTGATFGKCLYFNSDEKSAFAGYLIRPTFNAQVNTKFFSYFAQSGLYWAQANSLVTGGGQPQFNANVIKKIKLYIPSLDEQEKIVSHLDKVSDEIGQLKIKYQTQLDDTDNLKKSVLEKAFKGELIK